MSNRDNRKLWALAIGVSAALALLAACEAAAAGGGDVASEDTEPPTPAVITSLSGEVPGVTSGTVSLVYRAWDPPSAEEVATTQIQGDGSFSFDSLPDLELTHGHVLAPIPFVIFEDTRTAGVIEISDPSVRGALFRAVEIDSSATSLYSAVLVSESDYEQVGWVYADGPTEITGFARADDPAIVSIALEKGWNRLLYLGSKDTWLLTIATGPQPADVEWTIW
jgi:hypothetical protein